jgi:quinoprotein dehydrogenase-associated probable ABC transporter substrate-binding protein
MQLSRTLFLASLLAATSTLAVTSALAIERPAARGDYNFSTPYEQMTPAQIGAAKAAAKTRKVATLSVCADPGNMPLSDNKQQGFQNKIIEAVAEHLGARVEYFWRPYLERGLTRETFANNECDILLDMPTDTSAVLTTLPIYRSTYVLAYLKDKNYDFKNLDDPRLKELKIGTYQHSAIRIALAQHGIKNLQSLAIITSDADLRPENQPWRQLEKLVDGSLDVAGVWGPFAGWFQKVKGAPITLQPVNRMDDDIPLEFSLSIGVQNTDVVLKFMLDHALVAKKDEIEKILADYGVPLVQCSDCIAAGSLPSHGSYDKALAKKYEERYLKSATARPATSAASEDQVVSQKRLEEWLASGADVDAELGNAVMAFDPERVKFLIGKGAHVNKLNDNGYSPLHTAARSRNSDIVKLLLDSKADPNLPDSDGVTPLVHAIMRNHVPSIEALLAAGADIERETKQGYTPLEVAIGEDQLFAARALINAGAKVDVTNGKQKITPLMLVASQLSPQARATHLAAGPTPIDIAELLIDKGAAVDAKSAAGVTSLMVAAGHNNAPMIGLLLGKGANPALKNNVGKTALDIAREARNEVAVGALQLLAVPSPN